MTKEETIKELMDLVPDGEQFVELVTEVMDEKVHELKSSEAADINNGGLWAQIEFILESYPSYKKGATELGKELKEIIRDAKKDASADDTK